jgi:RHS repeat-associated protein
MTQVATGTATSTYAYDYMNQRVKEVAGSVTTIYPHKYWNIVGATSTAYIYAGDQLLSTIVADGRSTTTRYIHTDHLGSTNVVTNASGTPVQVIDYLPYGGIRYSSSTAQTSEKHQFIGQYTDSTGLNYLNARYLQNTRGQFFSQDPLFWSGNQNLKDPQSQNSYSYSNNNPINRSDPSGLLSVEDSAKLDALRSQLLSISYSIQNLPANTSQAALGSLQGALSATGNVLSQFGSGVANGFINPLNGVTKFNDTSVPFAQGLGNLFGVAAALQPFGGIEFTEGRAVGRAAFEIGTMLKSSTPVKAALKSDIYHRAPTFVRDEAADIGDKFMQINKDGTQYFIVQMKGVVNNVEGVFEYGIDHIGDLTHQRFKPGGLINGILN